MKAHPSSLLFSLALMLAAPALHAATTVDVSLTANGASRWYDYFSDAYGQINLNPSGPYEDGFYQIGTNTPLGGGADIFPNEGNWANVGTLTLSGTVQGVGVETFNIVSSTFDFDQYIADNDAILNTGYLTQMGAISTGTISFLNGVVTDIDFSSGISFIYDFSGFGAGPLPFSGTLAINNAGFDLFADSSYPSGFGNDIRFVWDADGSASFNYAVPEPSRALLLAASFGGVCLRRRRKHAAA